MSYDHEPSKEMKQKYSGGSFERLVSRAFYFDNSFSKDEYRQSTRDELLGMIEQDEYEK